MKKFTKLLIVFLAIAAIIAITVFSVSASTYDGSYFVIETPEDLVEFAKAAQNNRKINAKLTADIDMTGVDYAPPAAGYYGRFDGQGHTITGLTRTVENATAGNYGLLFNTLGNGYGEFLFGEVMNLTLKDCSITVTSTTVVNVGAITGKCDRNDIYDVNFINVDVTVSGAENSSAGLATGLSCWASTRGANGSIEYFGITADKDCQIRASGTNVWAGSIVGLHTDNPIYFHGCSTEATVTAENGGAGGIIGYQKSGNNPRFFDITVKATVSGSKQGALAGYAAAPDYGLCAIDNQTSLPVYGAKTQEGRLNYFDDTATYGVCPKTDDGKYCISTYDELRWFVKFYGGNNNMNRIRQEATILLTADIDMKDKDWKPFESFLGTIDGNGHTISNITVVAENAANDTKHGLLCGVLGNNKDAEIFGVVKNITIKDSTLTVKGDGVKYNVGGVAGESNRGSFYDIKLENVDISVTGNLNSGTVIGGMTGWVAYGAEREGRDYIQSFLSCHLDEDCSITSDSPNADIGGIFGILGQECARILDCTVSATLTGKGNVGGLAGNMASGGNRWFMISDCGFFGKITSGKSSGGAVGYASKSGFIYDTTVTGIIEGDVTGQFVGSKGAETQIHEKRNSDGSLTVKNGKAIQLYAQTRVAEAGHDLRIVLLADLAKLGGMESLTVKTSFYKANDTLVKSHTGKLAKTNSDYVLYKSIKAGSETLTAGENNAIFGEIITDIPNGAYDYYTVTVTDQSGNTVIEGTTKPTETSLEGKTFYFLGSSVTYGSASGGRSMADLIAERNNCTVVKEAVSGTTLVDNDGGSYVSRMKNSSYFKKDAKVDHFIVQLSTNDAGQNRTLGAVSDSRNLEDFDTMTIIGAMEYIICYAKTTWDCEVSFYIGTMYNSNLYVDMIGALYDLEEKWGIGVIDMFFDIDMCKVARDDYKKFISDPVHPNIYGYEAWWTPVFEKHLMSYEYN